MRWLDLIGYAAMITGLITYLPQVIKSWRTKKTEDIALGMYVVFWLGVVCWFAYGFLTMNFPIMLNNVIMFFLISTMIFLKRRYG